MTVAIIITLCILLLLAYAFDLTSKKTKIPSVVLLLLLGWSLQQGTALFKIQVTDLTPILPILGTVGLILIVFEGSLELEFNRSKMATLRKALFGAGFSILILGVALACVFSLVGPYPFKDSLTNVIPLCVISSAIAIPSAQHLSAKDREFVIYESSISDILGVVLFNFVALNEVFNGLSFLTFGFQLIVMAIVSFVATLGLAYLLSRIRSHVKFVPILLIMMLVYTLCKLYHLPALFFILLFGLFIGNIDELNHVPWIHRFRPEELGKEVTKLKELVAEATFLIRSLFFLVFGFLLKTADILNTETILWSGVTVGLIYGVRALQLTLSRMPLNTLFFIAPRGLITILLFLSINPGNSIPLVNNSLITQVIIMTALVMMLGSFLERSSERHTETH